ncbi:hypothetical protein FRX31_004018, partial [Thalictrum thalictroides]
ICPEASLLAFKELQVLKESILNRTKSIKPLSVGKKDISSTSCGGDHYEANTSFLKSVVVNLPVEEQIGDLLLEKESVPQKDDNDLGNTVGDNDLVNTIGDNVVVVKDKKGTQRIYDINRVDDGNEGEDPFFFK